MPDAVAGSSVLANRYELHEVLGQGGMADVYRATDRLLDRQVAVKLLRDTTEDEGSRARFTREARTLAGLTHSGLVTVLDAGITVERPFIVMDLVEGPTLSAALGAGPLGPDRTRGLGRQVAEALAYAHDRGVVHRDVKPGNILIGRNGRARLTDFGIARLIGDAVHHTRTGQTIGTAAYLAPEQVSGTPVTGAADVYALGLVLLECLTGRRAYSGPPTEAALQRLSRDPEVPAHLPEPWVSLLTAMTAREPDARPPAAEVAEALRTGHYAARGSWQEPTAPFAAVGLRPAGPPAGARPAVRAERAPASERIPPAASGRGAHAAGRSLEHRIALYAFSAVAVLALVGVLIGAFASGDPAAPLTESDPPAAVQPSRPAKPASDAVVPPGQDAERPVSTGTEGSGPGRGSGGQEATEAESEADRDAEKAAKEAEQAAREAEREAEKAAQETLKELQKQAQEARKDAQKQAQETRKDAEGRGDDKGRG